ncbi:hypothetical protein [Cloacibacterium normanense]|uniref:hypothetical protein n=1 Tax=Cloacibacterium normanense TaxID=237258 RepID=UPI00391A6D7A
MLRKRIAILFFLVAQVIILGHGIIQHHHHLDKTAEYSIHFGKEVKDQHLDENPLQFALSNMPHGGEQVSFTHSGAIKYVIEKQVLNSIDVLSCDSVLPVKHEVTFRKSPFPLEREQIYKSPQNGIHKLRGPPIFIVA